MIVLLVLAFFFQTHETCAPCHSEQVTDFKTHKHFEKKLSCDACHGKSEAHVKAAGGTAPDRVAGPVEVPILCGGCHPAQKKLFDTSKHATAIAARTKSANCSTCHGVHALKTEKQRESQCIRCHQVYPPHDPHSLKLR